MALTHVGEMSLSAVLPLPIAVGLTAGADLDLQLKAALAVEIGITLPSIQLDLDLALQIVASLQAALSIGLTMPGIDIQITAMLDLIASLKLRLELVLGFINLCASAGVNVWAYDGPANALGTELGAALSGGVPGGTGPTEHINALILATNLSATWGAMGQIFKVTP